MCEQSRDCGLIHAAGCRGCAVLIARRAGARAKEIVDQRIRRSGVAGNGIVIAIDECDVGDAAEIEHRDRRRLSERASERLMKHRHQRRALPSCRHVSSTKIIDYRHPDLARERSAVADLDRQLLFRAMQNGLPVIADDIN